MPSLFVLAILAIIIIWLLLRPLYKTLGKKAKKTYKNFQHNLKEDDDDE